MDERKAADALTGATIVAAEGFRREYRHVCGRLVFRGGRPAFMCERVKGHKGPHARRTDECKSESAEAFSK